MNDVGIFLSDNPFKNDMGIVNLHPSKGTQWVAYMNENFFESYGFVCPKKLSKIMIKRNGHRFYSQNKIQGLTNKPDSY